MDKTFVPIRTDVVLQNETAQLYRSYQDFLQFEHLYSSAVREIQTRLEVLNEEFSVRYDHNPIHHVESRLKSTGSIIEKLRRKGLEISMESAKKNINDIAGIRVVCDDRDEKIGYKIREARGVDRVPYMLILGEKEVEAGNISVRDRSNETVPMAVDEFIAKVVEETRTRA